MPNQKNIEQYKFTKGHIGKGGRPKGSKNISTILKELLSGQVEITDKNNKKTKLSVTEAIGQKLIINALAGDIKAIREIADRTEGKSIQKIQHSGEDGGPINLINHKMTDEEATAIYLANLKKNAKK